jgi:hypothetical protein
MVTVSTKSYDQTRNEFHMMIGYCVAEWAGIDDELFRIFQHCTGVKEKQAAILYYRTPGLDSRLKMVDEIVRSVLPKKPDRAGSHDHPDVKRWKKISAQCSNLFGTRRRIAHQPVRAQETLAPAGPPPIPYLYIMDQSVNNMTMQASFEIYTSQTEMMRGKESKLSPLTLTDLQEHQKTTSQVRSQINMFFREVLEPV